MADAAGEPDSPEKLIESALLRAQSEYGRGWNRGMSDAVAILRSEGWLRDPDERAARGG